MFRRISSSRLSNALFRCSTVASIHGDSTIASSYWTPSRNVSSQHHQYADTTTLSPRQPLHRTQQQPSRRRKPTASGGAYRHHNRTQLMEIEDEHSSHPSSTSSVPSIFAEPRPAPSTTPSSPQTQSHFDALWSGEVSPAELGLSPSASSSSSSTHQPSQQHHQRSRDEDGYELLPTDPLLFVKYNSRDRRLHFNRSQREMIWEARKQQYHASLKRIVVTLESHLTVVQKCHQFLYLHEHDIMKHRLRLRPDTYEEMFHYFSAVAGGVGLEDPKKRSMAAASAARDQASASTIASQSVPFLNSVWTMYRYMIDSGSNPTPATIQHIMSMLERVQKKDPEVESRAHSLMMDADRFKISPTDFTVASYVGVCAVNGAMHIAVARVSDHTVRQERQLTSGICARVVHGFNQNQQYDDALAFVATLTNASVSNHLLNAVLVAALHSKDPLSVFAFYKSLCVNSKAVVPSVHTMTILMQAVLKLTQQLSEEEAARRNNKKDPQQQHRVRPSTIPTSTLAAARALTQRQQHPDLPSPILSGNAYLQLAQNPSLVALYGRFLPLILREMKRYRIRGSESLLNQLLGGLVVMGRRDWFQGLRSNMVKRKVRVHHEKFPW